MLGDGGLRDAELLLHGLTHVSGGPLTTREQLEDAASYRVPQDVKRVHASMLASLLI